MVFFKHLNGGHFFLKYDSTLFAAQQANDRKII